MGASYAPYPEYKEPGVEWLDVIPRDWVVSKVKYLAPFQVGWTPPTKVDANFIGDNLWANISDLKGKRLATFQGATGSPPDLRILLQTVLSTLIQSGQGNALTSHLPHQGPSLSSGILLFLNALKAGSTKSWAGEDTLSLLRTAGRTELAQQLSGDNMLITRPVDTGQGEWRMTQLPILHEGVLHQANLFVRDREQNKNGQDTILRIYIDSDQGISIEDCERVSHQVSGILDVEEPITAAYSLEVSSPGFDRPLFKERDFKRFSGSKAKISMKLPIDGRRNFTGVLQGCDDGEVLIEVDGEVYALPISKLAKARLIA